MIGIQETFANPLTTSLMILVLVTTVFHILKESLNKQDETHGK